MMWRNWSDFWYDVADFFFAKQMDKAYDQGIRMGSEFAARKISFQIHSVPSEEMTKTQRVGYDAAMEALIEAKKDVMRQTGAML